jgi:NDP-4-keto-2,6-dideoxyhexose 3-C-methyltransferase
MKVWSRCRHCDAPDLAEAFSLGDEFALSSFPHYGETVVKAPLTLCMCHLCGLVQLRHSVDRDLLYRDYFYRSGTNESMVRHLREVAEFAQHFVSPLGPRDAILDIGCNDGTLLNQFPTACFQLGIDPSVEFGVFGDGRTIVRDYYPLADRGRFYPPADAFKIITSIAMFYDLDDQRGFIQEIYRDLADDGVWVVEFQDLDSMLRTTGFDAICHEHVTYNSLETFEGMVWVAGMHVETFRHTSVNGGSLLLAVKKGKDSPFAPQSAANEPRGWSNLRRFGDRTHLAVEALNAEIDRRPPRSVMGYGASTKGNTLLQFAGIGPDRVPLVGDRNPEKWGRLTATGIPIVSEDEVREKASALLALPWHFRDSFIARERRFLDRGGEIIFPLPLLEVVRRTV